MKIKLILLTALILGLSNAEIKAQCPDSNAKLYLDKVQAAKNWTPTERVNSGNKVQRWTQISAWYAYNCECNQSTYTVKGVTKPRTADQAEAIRNSMNAISRTIQSNYPNAEFKPAIRNTPCGSGTSGGQGNNSISSNSVSPSQQKLMQSFANYNQAMSLKKQGEGIAKAFAEQVKGYSQLNQAASPQNLLQEFNKNMQAIADLQAQNKADNLNQISSTISTSINNYSSGNHEGGLYSALSLLDQGEARREAKRKVERYKQQLIYQAQKQMSDFYWKAMNLNDQTIDQYYQNAAYAFSKPEEDYLLNYVKHHECFKESMTNNFSYSSTSWTTNNCPAPQKVNSMVNNLVAEDLQYIQAAKRKYQLYLETGRDEFQQGAMKFAGLAANTNPKAEYYYFMGHFAGVNNPIVAYSAFLNAQSKSPGYFKGEKQGEFKIIELSMEAYFKQAIEENHQEVIKNIVGAGLHHAVNIEGKAPIVYAVTIDQADVVQAFLNTDLEGRSQNEITKKVREIIVLAAVLDAPRTVERFANMGFGVDFTIDGKSPLDEAEQALALNSFKKIAELMGGQTKYSFKNSDLIKVRDLAKASDVNNTTEVVRIYQLLPSKNSKEKAIIELLYGTNRKGFFEIYKIDKALLSSWSNSNQRVLYTQCFKDLLNRTQLDAWKYFDHHIINLDSGIILTGWKKELFNSIAIDIAVEMENAGEKNLDMVLTDQAYSGMSKYFFKADKSKFSDFNFDGFKYNSIIVKDLTNNSSFGEINLIDFAIKRRDKKLLKTLLTEYKYVQVKNQTLPINEKILKSEGYKLDSDFLLMRTVRAYGFWSQECYGIKNQFTPNKVSVLSTPLQTEYEILHMLIFEFGFDEDAIKIICDHGVFKYGSKGDFSMYSNFKKLIDELIEGGHKSTFLTTWRYNQFKSCGNQQVKNDKKYWKAVVNGDYAKRY